MEKVAAGIIQNVTEDDGGMNCSCCQNGFGNIYQYVWRSLSHAVLIDFELIEHMLAGGGSMQMLFENQGIG